VRCSGDDGCCGDEHKVCQNDRGGKFGFEVSHDSFLIGGLGGYDCDEVLGTHRVIMNYD
jgi:hypothetical protein